MAQIDQHQWAIVPTIGFGDIGGPPEVRGEHLRNVVEGRDDGIVDDQEVVIPDKSSAHEGHVHREVASVTKRYARRGSVSLMGTA